MTKRLAAQYNELRPHPITILHTEHHTKHLNNKRNHHHHHHHHHRCSTVPVKCKERGPEKAVKRGQRPSAPLAQLLELPVSQRLESDAGEIHATDDEREHLQ